MGSLWTADFSRQAVYDRSTVEIPRHRKKCAETDWYSRGYLPHLDSPITQFVTFRLGDSLPQGTLEGWRAELRYLPRDERKLELYRRAESWIDRGMGACVLRQPHLAEILEAGLIAHHGVAYRLLGWVIMPNHVHFLAEFKPEREIGATIQQIKGVSARAINRLLGRRGSLWAREFFDRYMRSDRQLRNTLAYILRNPERAKLVEADDRWHASSARFPTSEEGNLVLSEAAITAARMRWDEIRADFSRR